MENVDSLIEAIRNAFPVLPVPGHCIKSSDNAVEMTPSVPTYDRFADTQYIEISNHINAEVEGKRWDEIRADNFIEAINYITVEAVAYYMPSIFIHNLQNKDELNWLLCLRIQSGHLCVPYRQELYEVLNQAQRALVAKYMVQIGGFFPQDIEFWQTTNPSD